MSLYFRSNLILFLLFTLLFGVVYPGCATLLNQLVFPQSSGGSLIAGKDGKPLGSVLIGQNFSAPKYFWGRPSATTVAYDASSSSGSNLGAANPAQFDAVKGHVADLQKADPDNHASIPVDLVTASGSGLDPHISPEAAYYQAARIAKARGMDESAVRNLITHYTEGRQFGFLGEPRVNVLMLNLALDGKL